MTLRELLKNGAKVEMAFAGDVCRVVIFRPDGHYYQFDCQWEDVMCMDYVIDYADSLIGGLCN